MTRARTASNGLGTPPPLDRWIDAVLMLCVSLVQGAATTLGMIFKRNYRDWHTETAHEDLPQAKSGIQLQESTHTHGVILGLVPRIPVGSSRGLSIDPHETHNRDSRDEPENDSADVASTGANPVIPDARKACEPEPRGHTHICHNRAPGSRSRQGASGMTPLM